MPTEIDYRLDPNPPTGEFAAMWRAAWGSDWRGDLGSLLSRSLVHVGAYAGERLVGYVNVATDGGRHAFLLDTTVRPDFQGHGIGTQLVARATKAAAERGAAWLHVDYEPHLDGFYKACGFHPTAAGLIDLTR